jgi:hypothetical protein
MTIGLIKIVNLSLWFFPFSIFCQALDSLSIIQKARYHIDTLCSTTFNGRGYIANGHMHAADYIKKEFEKYGLNPICPSGMIQTFQFPLNVIENAELIVQQKKLVPSKDFLPASNSPDVNVQNAKIQFIGYGTEKNWIKIKAQGKWVAIEEGSPPNAPDSLKDWFKLENQIQQAKQSGAAGLIVLQNKLTHSFSKDKSNLPVLFIQKNLKFRQIDSYKVQSSLRNQSSQNVIAFQRGIIDSTIVLCAHYDHLGSLGETIFRGANDNASGTAFLLVLAEQVAKIQTRYNILWIAFGAEETGLNGSIYYVFKEPCIPLEKVKFVFNFDLLGHGQEGVMAVGAKTYPQLFQVVTQTNQKLGNLIKFSERPNAANSDHYPFTLQNIPALFFYTMGGPKHYHDYLDLPQYLELVSFVSLQKIILEIIR